jgi:hypothetical protein
MIRRVIGNSMSPALTAGDIVIAWREPLKPGQIVIARQNGQEVIKRVAKLSNSKAYLTGDNSHESHDSRHFGPVPVGAILGVVMIRLPRAVAPPKPREPIARQLGLILSGLMLVMALLHLIRIDKLIPLIDTALPGDVGYAVAFICTVAAIEVFSIPFLLGMKLSPLARIFGGLFVVLVPLIWTCLTIWTLGKYETTGQFSSYLNVHSDGLLLFGNAVWLLVSYWTLYLFSYDKTFKQLSK